MIITALGDLAHAAIRLVELMMFAAILILVVIAAFWLLRSIWRMPRVHRLTLTWLGPIYDHTLMKFTRRLQFQLVLVFAASSLAFVVVDKVCNDVFGSVISNVTMSYSSSLAQLANDAEQMAAEVSNPANRPTDFNGHPMTLQAALNQQSEQSNEQVYVVDSSGKVLVSSNNVQETRVDMAKIIQSATTSVNGSYIQGQMMVQMYPVTYHGNADYVVVEGVPTPNLVYTQGNNPLSAVAGLAAFLVTFYQLTKRKIKYLRELGAGLHQIAGGKLDFRVTRRGSDELTQLADDINTTAHALEERIESERLAEKTKSELITNVSHDLRTPLTLIMGYLRILKDRKYENEEQYDEYVNIAYEKSEKLSVLIGNLFEYTKLANQGVRLEYQDVSLNEMLRQLLEEMVSVAAESGVQFRREFTPDRLVVHVDPNQMTRVFENLLSNSIQHSDKPGEVGVRLYRDDNNAVLEISNQGYPINPDEMPRLFDRFYRADSARTSNRGGSGLGLAIAKSIVDLHKGTIRGDAEGKQIRFTVTIPLAIRQGA